jgi:hypothetical protein
VAPYLALCREDAPRRTHSLRAVFNGLRYIVKSGMQWRMMEPVLDADGSPSFKTDTESSVP